MGGPTVTVQTLAKVLRDAVDGAPRGEIVVRIHLFGIEFASELQKVSVPDVVEAAGVGCHT